jgi:lipopolysaccharide export system protein LptA
MLGQVLAQESDRDQPITIEADRVDVDEAKGTSVYKGNVIFRQGTIELLADELALRTTPQRELESAKAVGKPARFKQNAPEGEIRGHAQEITYQVATDYLLFAGDAYFSQCRDEVSGNLVEYFGQQGLVKARKSEGGPGRVQVILQPREEGESSKGCIQPGTAK